MQHNLNVQFMYSEGPKYQKIILWLIIEKSKKRHNSSYIYSLALYIIAPLKIKQIRLNQMITQFICGIRETEKE